MLLGSWNLGGVAIDELPKGIQEAAGPNGGSGEHLLDGLFALQELPRGPTGWKADSLHGWEILSHRFDEQWRGTGIMYNPKVWTVMRRRHFERGMWVRVRHVMTKAEMWIGSIRCTQRCTQVTHAQEIRQALHALQPTSLPTVLMGDVNACVGWGSDAKELFPFGKDGKSLRMMDLLKSRSLCAHPPRENQRHLPTSRPRKPGIQGNVIDVIASARVEMSPMVIARDSCDILGTDQLPLWSHCVIKRGIRNAMTPGRGLWCNRFLTWRRSMKKRWSKLLLSAQGNPQGSAIKTRWKSKGCFRGLGQRSWPVTGRKRCKQDSKRDISGSRKGLTMQRQGIGSPFEGSGEGKTDGRQGLLRLHKAP